LVAGESELDNMNWNESVIDQVVEEYYAWRAKLGALSLEFRTIYAQAEREGGNASWQKASQVFARAFQNPLDGLARFLTPELLEEIEYQRQSGNLGVQISFFKASAESAFRTLQKLEAVFDTQHFHGPVLLAFEAFRDGKGGLEFVLTADANRWRLEKWFQDIRDRGSGI
jgi:hypothetical protein